MFIRNSSIRNSSIRNNAEILHKLRNTSTGIYVNKETNFRENEFLICYFIFCWCRIYAIIKY